MTIKKDRFWRFAGKAQFILAALLIMFFVGGSQFNAAGQRSAAELAGNQTFPEALASSSSLSSFSESGSAIAPVSTNPFQELYCASDNGRRRYCNADTRGGVRLVRQRSDSPCIAGRTWGYDRRGIWVDRGCRAEFIVGDYDYDRDRGYGRNRGRTVQTFYCESGDGRRHWCREGIGGTVRLVRQRSESPCIQGRTWGRDRSGVWVDRGCRADFEVRR
jgi:hypothetical protein